MKIFQLGQSKFSSKTSKIDNNQAEIQAYYKSHFKQAPSKPEGSAAQQFLELILQIF